jgi:hypothetical protein
MEKNDMMVLLNSVNKYYQNSLVKKWIKLVPLNNLVLFENYNRKDYFTPVADIVLDTEVYTYGDKKGMKKRNTLIQFIPKIPLSDFDKKDEWVYMLLINKGIVKIGGTRSGLKGRITSYLSGHHINERGKSGDCSKTNGFIYNTFEFYLNMGYKIEMYAYKLPYVENVINIFDKEIKIKAQTYHAYETTFLEDYKKIYNSYPVLSDKCDPDYKTN